MSHARHKNESNTSIKIVTHAKIIRGLIAGFGSGCKDSRAKYRHAYELVTSHTSIRHVTYMNESCFTQNYLKRWMEGFLRQISLNHTYEWVMSHIWMSHVSHRTIWRGSPKGEGEWKDSRAKYRWVTHTSESCCIHECVIYINESCHLHDYSHEVGVDGKILAPNIAEGEAYMNELCHEYKWVMFHTGLFARGGGGCKDSRAKYCWGWGVHPYWGSLAWNESCLPKVSVCEMTHPYAGYDSFVIAAWLVHTCHVYPCYRKLVCVRGLLHMCDMTRLYMTHSFVGSDLCICTIRIIYNTKFPHRIFLTNSS